MLKKFLLSCQLFDIQMYVKLKILRKYNSGRM